MRHRFFLGLLATLIGWVVLWGVVWVVKFTLWHIIPTAVAMFFIVKGAQMIEQNWPDRRKK